MMSSFPYLLKPKTLPKILENFPISFGCDLKLPEHHSHVQEVDHKYEIIAKFYSSLVNALASGDLHKLEGIYEFNLIKKLDEERRKLESLGMGFKVMGSLDKTEVTLIRKDIFIGSILPFRNLFLPDEEYQIYTSRFIRDEFRNINVSVNSEMPVQFKFAELNDIDFVQANKSSSHSLAEKLKDFHQITNLIKLEAENQEFALKTNLKLLVVNSSNQVISENENDEPECHTVILERFRFFGFNYKIYSSRTKKAEALYNSLLKGYLHNNVVVDFDGSMDRNPPVPKHLLT